MHFAQNGLLSVQVAHIHTDPDTDKDETITIMGRPIQSEGRVIKLMYTVSSEFRHIHVSVTNDDDRVPYTQYASHLRAFYVCGSEREPVDSLEKYELHHAIRTKNNHYVRDEYIVNVRPNLETVIICNAVNNDPIFEIIFQIQID